MGNWVVTKPSVIYGGGAQIGGGSTAYVSAFPKYQEPSLNVSSTFADTWAQLFEYIKEYTKSPPGQVGLDVVGKRVNILTKENVELKENQVLLQRQVDILRGEVATQTKLVNSLLDRIELTGEQNATSETKVGKPNITQADIEPMLTGAATELGWDVAFSYGEDFLEVEVFVPKSQEDLVADTTFDFYAKVAEGLDQGIFKEILFDFVNQSDSENG